MSRTVSCPNDAFVRRAWNTTGKEDEIRECECGGELEDVLLGDESVLQCKSCGAITP